MRYILIGSGSKNIPHPINTRKTPNRAKPIVVSLRLVRGSFRKIRAKIKMKIVAVWFRILAFDAWMRLIPKIQQEIPK